MELPLAPRGFVAVLLAVLAGTPAAAQRWIPSLFDDGTVAIATARVAGGQSLGLSLYCAGPSPQPHQLQPSDVTELQRSDPGEVLLTLDGGLVGGMRPGKLAITLSTGGGRWQADFQSNQMDEYYYAELPFDADVIAGLKTGDVLSVVTDRGTQASVPLWGSAAAIDQTLAYCRASFPAVDAVAASHAPAVGAQAGNRWTADALLRSKQAACAEFGPGAPKVEPGFVREASIDGDGAPDFIVDWSKLTCAGAGLLSSRSGAGSCASEGCGQDVYLSSSGGSDPAMQVQAFELIPRALGEGRADLYAVVNGTACDAPAAEFACAVRWQWNGTAFVPAGQPIRMKALRALLALQPAGSLQPARAVSTELSVAAAAVSAPAIAAVPPLAPANEVPLPVIGAERPVTTAVAPRPSSARTTPTTSSWVEAPLAVSRDDFVQTDDLAGAILAVNWIWEDGVEMGELGSMIFAPGPIGDGIEVPSARALMQKPENGFENSYDATPTTIRIGFEGNAPQRLPRVAGVSPWLQFLDTTHSMCWIQRARVLETNIAGLDASRIHIDGALMPNFAGLAIDGDSFAVLEFQTR